MNSAHSERMSSSAVASSGFDSAVHELAEDAPPAAPRRSRSGTSTPPRTGGRRRGSPTRGRAPPTSGGRARWSRSGRRTTAVAVAGIGEAVTGTDDGGGVAGSQPDLQLLGLEQRVGARLDLGEQRRERVGDEAPEREILCGERLEPGGRTRGHDASLPPGCGCRDRARSEGVPANPHNGVLREGCVAIRRVRGQSAISGGESERTARSTEVPAPSPPDIPPEERRAAGLVRMLAVRSMSLPYGACGSRGPSADGHRIRMDKRP